MTKSLDIARLIENVQALPVPDAVAMKGIHAEWQNIRANLCRVLGMRFIQEETTPENARRLSELRKEMNGLVMRGEMPTFIMRRKRSFGSGGAGVSIGGFPNKDSPAQREINDIISIIADLSGEPKESVEMLDVNAE